MARFNCRPVRAAALRPFATHPAHGASGFSGRGDFQRQNSAYLAQLAAGDVFKLARIADVRELLREAVKFNGSLLVPTVRGKTSQGSIDYNTRPNTKPPNQ